MRLSFGAHEDLSIEAHLIVIIGVHLAGLLLQHAQLLSHLLGLLQVVLEQPLLLLLTHAFIIPQPIDQTLGQFPLKKAILPLEEYRFDKFALVLPKLAQHELFANPLPVFSERLDHPLLDIDSLVEEVLLLPLVLLEEVGDFLQAKSYAPAVQARAPLALLGGAEEG